MWPLLRAELTYTRVFLVAAWAIAAGVALFVNLMVFLGGKAEPFVIGVLPGLFIVVASMVAAFIAQGSRAEEHRLRLYLQTPHPPLEVALAMVAVPVVFTAAGAAVGLVTVLVTDLVLGPLARVTPQIPATVALHLLAVNLLGLLAAEASTAWTQRRRGRATTAWLVFIVCLPFVGIVHVRESFSLMPTAATASVVLLAGAMTVAMFVRRTVYLR